jgi:hypothetical protein
MVVLVTLEYLIVLIVDFAILGKGGAADAGGLAVNISIRARSFRAR